MIALLLCLPALADARQDAEARVGLGLVLAGRGRTSEALAVWTELIADDGIHADLRDRARLERQRTERYVVARTAFFERLVASGKKLVFDWRGERLVTAVRAFDEHELVCEENRRGVERLAIEALDPLELADWMGDTKYGRRTGWIRNWPGVLAGDERSLRRLEYADDPETESILRDVESTWPALLELGSAAVELYDLAGATPDGVEDGLRWLERLERLMAEHGDLDLVRDRVDALRSLADPVVARVSTAIGVDALFAARGTDLESGRHRLRYAFDDPGELEDFVVADEIPAYYARFVELETSNTPLEVSNGALHARGRHLLTHVVPFDAPLSVRWTIEFRSGVVEDPLGVNLAVFACHDGWEQYVMNVNLGDLEVRDGARFEVDRIPEDERFLPYDTPHEVALIHAGDVVRVEVAGETVAEISGRAPQSGAVTVYLHSDMPLWLHDLEIEGSIPSASLRSRRRAWADARRAALR